jgi:hypothetical protein
MAGHAPTARLPTLTANFAQDVLQCLVHYSENINYDAISQSNPDIPQQF